MCAMMSFVTVLSDCIVVLHAHTVRVNMVTTHNAISFRNCVQTLEWYCTL